MADTLKKFGKYFLLDLLAQGGMAEIYRARHATPTGGGRLLAMKRIQQSYSSNPEFINMFRGETKVTSGFTHPNIVQVYDYGEEQGQLYIAMEYVDGRNLRQFIGRLGELKSSFPLEVSCYIIEQSAQALHYAHEFKDKFSGKSLNIIHRDVSPQNILVSYDGAVKVIDFGIAKTETQAEATRAGVIKGKPSYLSPEQIAGETLDGRSDVFALAAVFWELLTGKKLFSGENDLAVIRMVENCQNHIKAPSLVNSKVPKELDAILMKALEKDRSKRYQTAGELQRAIHKFLYQFAPEFNPADLSFYARDLFKNEILEDRKRLLKLNEKAEQLLSSPEAEAVPSPSPTQPPVASESVAAQPAAPAPGTKIISTPQAPAEIKKPATTIAISAEDEKTASHLTLETAEAREPKDSRDTRAAASHQATSTTHATSAAAGVSLQRQPTASRQPQNYRTQTGMTRTKTSTRSSSTTSFSLGKVAVIAAISFGCGYLYLNYSELSQRRNPASVATNHQEVEASATRPAATANPETKEDPTLRQPATANISQGNEKTIMLHLRLSPAGGSPRVKINGQDVGFTPGSAFPVPLDQNLELSIERQGFDTFRKSLIYESARIGSLRDTLMDAELIPLKYGFISINTTPSAEGTIFIDGGEERVQTPLSGKRLPVGTYRIRLENKLLQLTKDITVIVEENRVKKIEERLSVVNDGG